MDVTALPFNKWLGIQAHDDGVFIQPKNEHLNRLETVHATVIYRIAEAASGHWLLN